MITITHAVEEILLSSPFFREAASQDLLNVSGFARVYKQEIERRTRKSVTLGAIIMAVRRIVRNQPKSHTLQTLWKSNPDIIVRSNLFEITIMNDPTFISKQKKVLEYESDAPQTLITITHGIFETTIIASMTIMDKIVKLYEEATLISTITDISAITIKFPKDFIDIPGVIYSILNTIAWNGVSVVEVVSTYSEFTVILRQEDVDRAFSLLQKLFK